MNQLRDIHDAVEQSSHVTQAMSQPDPSLKRCTSLRVWKPARLKGLIEPTKVKIHGLDGLTQVVAHSPHQALADDVALTLRLIPLREQSKSLTDLTR
jgi:hypothetical protein